MTLLTPVVILRALQSLKQRLHTGAVCAVWVGKVASSIDLVWAHLAQKFDDDVDIGIGELTLLYTASLVEWHIEEVGVGVGVKAE